MVYLNLPEGLDKATPFLSIYLSCAWKFFNTLLIKETIITNLGSGSKLAPEL